MSKTIIAVLFSAMLLLANEWMSCGTWGAIGVLQTDILPLRGEKCRLKLNVRGDQAFQAILYSAANKRIKGLAKLSEGLNHGKSTANAVLPQSLEHGYIRFIGEKYQWEAELEQYMAEVDRWETLQEFNKKQEFLPLGSWCGEGGEEKEIRITIPSGHWKITAKSVLAGKLFVELTTPEGDCLYRDTLFSANTTRTSWGHEKGDFILKIRAGAAPWVVTIEMN